MHRTRIPSPARSQGTVTPRRKTRSTRSVGSPARSSTSGRLTSIIDQFKEANRDSNSFAPSPLGKTLLNDNTEIEQPRRQSWWKKVNHSRNISEVLETGKAMEPNNIMDDLEVEVMSQSKKNFSLDLPESSGSESIASIVIPQRKLFTQKENVPQNKFGQIIGSRKSITQNQTNAEDKTLNVSTKTLFGQGVKRSRPAFPAGLLNLSPDKTLANKTKELATEVKAQPRSLFGNRPATKKRNMFADFIVSESEDDISEIQPKLFAFQRNANPVRHSTASRGNQETSPTSSHTTMTTDIEMEDWKMLPSSTMVEHQFDALASSTPGRKTRLSKLSEAKESSAGTNSNNTINKTKLSNKSASKNKSKITPDLTTKEPELEKANTSKSNQSKIIENKCEVEKTIKDLNSPINKSKANKTKNTSQKTITENEDMIDANSVANNINDHTQVLNKTGNKNLPVIDEKSREVTDIQSEANSRVLNNQTYKVNNETAKANIIQDNNDDEDENITLTYDDNEQQPEDRDKTVEEKVEELFNDKPADNISVKTHDKSNSKQSKMQVVVAEIEREIPKDHSEQKGYKDQQNINDIDVNVVQNDEQHPETDHQIGKEQDKVTGDNAIDIQEHKVDNEEIVKEREQVDGEAMEVDQEIEALAEAANTNNDAEKEEVNAETDQNEEANDNDEEIQDIREAENSQDIQNESEAEENEHQSESAEIENEEDQIDSEVENDEEEQNKSDVDVDQEDQIESEIEESDEEGVQNEEGQNESEVDVDQEEQNESEIEEVDEDGVQNEEEQNESEVDVDQEEQNESEIEEVDEEGVQNEEEQNESEVEVDQEEQNESEIEEVDEEGVQGDVENEEEVDQNEEETEDIDEEQENETEEDPEVEMEVSESEQEETEEIDAAQEASEAETPNVTHDTTGRNRQKEIKSPEAILHNMSNPMDSFIAKGRNTSIRKTLLKNFTIRQSEVPLRESTELNDGSKNSTAEGSGWDSHRTTRKTLRQTFGKDFTPRKSLRALVMEKSAKRQTAINEANAKLHQANSTEIPDHSAPDIDVEFDNGEMIDESDHEASKRLRQTTLEMYLQKIQKENEERRLRIEAKVKESLKSKPVKIDFLNYAPYNKGIRKTKMKLTQKEPKAKRTRTNVVSLEDLPEEVLNDLKYKPPKRYRPANASWITKRLYTFLEAKLEPKYDYKARVRAEKLVQMLYEFGREARKQQRVAAPHAVAQMKHEMARLDIVKTHFEFYDFIREYLPKEVKVKVVPDIVNDIPLPRTGVFSDIIQ